MAWREAPQQDRRIDGEARDVGGCDDYSGERANRSPRSGVRPRSLRRKSIPPVHGPVHVLRRRRRGRQSPRFVQRDLKQQGASRGAADPYRNDVEIRREDSLPSLRQDASAGQPAPTPLEHAPTTPAAGALEGSTPRTPPQPRRAPTAMAAMPTATTKAAMAKPTPYPITSAPLSAMTVVTTVSPMTPPSC